MMWREKSVLCQHTHIHVDLQIYDAAHVHLNEDRSHTSTGVEFFGGLQQTLVDFH